MHRQRDRIRGALRAGVDGDGEAAASRVHEARREAFALGGREQQALSGRARYQRTADARIGVEIDQRRDRAIVELTAAVAERRERRDEHAVQGTASHR